MSKRHIIVDIDGTIAKRVNRGPYDMTRVMEDEPVKNVIELILDLFASGYGIIFVTGRDYSAEKATKAWLLEHTGLEEDDCYLFMRGIGDTKSDDLIKQEIWETRIKNNFEKIQFVLDDRNKVVDMWRRQGLICLQVAEGNF